MKLKKTVCAIALATLFSAMGVSAVEKNITVTASVDTTIDLLQSDGSALPTSVALTYSPASNQFEVYSLNTAVHTNDIVKDVVVKLSADPVLSNILDPTEQIPMTVSFGGKELSTSDTTLSASSLSFGASGVSGVSSTQQLSIYAKADTAPSAGNYQGVVSIILTQST